MAAPEDIEVNLDDILNSVGDQLSKANTTQNITEEEKAKLEDSLKNTKSAKKFEAAKQRKKSAGVLKFLVVDDSTIVRRSISAAIKNWNARVLIDEAGHGQEAIDYIEDIKDYDMITLDYNMPGKNGMDVLKHMKTNNIKIPVVMVTTESERKTTTQAILMGAMGYVVKPFTPDNVISNITRILTKEGKLNSSGEVV